MSPSSRSSMQGGLPGRCQIRPAARDHVDMTSQRTVLGIDWARPRWVAVVLADGAAARVLADGDLPALGGRFPDAACVGVDMPIGLPEAGERAADAEARRFVGARRSSVFMTPPAAVLSADSYTEANAIAAQRSEKGISQQAWGLRVNIGRVAAVAATDPRVIEVHPEVSFAALAGGGMRAAKTTWNGQMDRRAALVRAGVLLPEAPEDPFAAEVVAVPTRGMERWLSQRMSDRLGASPGRADGVCANVGFPSPRRLVGDAVAIASGIDADTDPWLPERAVWPLLEVVEDHLGEPWLAALSHHLGGPGPAADPVRRARRLATLRHLAELFDRYALHRPAMVRAWAAGTDDDGAGGVLEAAARWQPELWRRLRDRIGVADIAARVDDACARLRAQPLLLDLPPRLGIFGLTRLPAGHLQVLRAIAAGRDVHLFLL